MKHKISPEDQEFMDTKYPKSERAMEFILQDEFFSGLKKVAVILLSSTILAFIATNAYDAEVDTSLACKTPSHTTNSTNDERMFKELEELLKI